MYWARGTRHLLFWTVFFLSALFHETYFSASFSRSPEWGIFLQIVSSQALMFLVKAAVVYYSIYVLIPAWYAEQTVALNSAFNKPDRSNVGFLIRFILVLLVGAMLMRLMMQFVIWNHIFHEERQALSVASHLARYFYSLFDLIPVSVTAVAVKLGQLQVRALKNETILVQEKLKSELLYLKSQTNPHFLFNTLNSIYVLSRKQDTNTPAAIMQLSKILRYILYEPIQSMNPIHKEIDLITDYIALQKLRFQEYIRVEFDVDTDNHQQEISPLLLLPLVENAFKHSNDTEISIHITLTLKNGKLDFIVSNSFSDHQAGEEGQREGIGLSNIRRQLAILYRHYTFDTQKENGQFKVTLHLDLNSLNV